MPGTWFMNHKMPKAHQADTTGDPVKLEWQNNVIIAHSEDGSKTDLSNKVSKGKVKCWFYTCRWFGTVRCSQGRRQKIVSRSIDSSYRHAR